MKKSTVLVLLTFLFRQLVLSEAMATPPLILTATQTQNNVTCYQLCNGSARVTPNGGAPPYTYSWSPSGGNAAMASSLCAGNYTCTITDAGNTTISKSFVITQPLVLSIVASTQSNVTCFGGANGTASVTAAIGGTTPYTYNWTPGNPTGDGSRAVTGLTAGTWTCTVTDSNSCTDVVVFTITEPDEVTGPTAALSSNGTSGASSAPQDALRYQRSSYLIRANEMQRGGFTSGMNLNSISFTNAVAPDTMEKGAFKVYLMNTNDRISKEDTAWTVINTTATSIKLTDLVLGQYDWQITSCSGASVDTGKTTFSNEALPQCIAPTSLRATGITANSCTLSWVAPASGATGYVVEYKKINLATWISVTASGTSVNLTGLSSDTTYEWRVRTQCGSVSSENNGTIFKTEFQPAGCNVPNVLAVSNRTDTTVRVSWTGASGAIRYALKYRRVNTIDWTEVTAPTSSFTITGLKSGTSYEWKVSTVCSAGTGTPVVGTSFSTTGTTKCYAPLTLTTDSLTESTAVLSWNSTGSAGYKVRYRLKKYITWNSVLNGNAQFPGIMTLVHNDSLCIPDTIGTYGVKFTGSGISPFTYTGGGLYVAFEYTHRSGVRIATENTALTTFGDSIIKSVNGIDSVYFPLCMASHDASGQENNLVPNKYRPETFFGSNALKDSVEVLNVYALGDHALGYTGPETIRALVKNHRCSKGRFEVSLTITSIASGVVRFSTTVQDSIAADTLRLFSFPAWSPSVAEKVQITVSVAADSGETATENNSLTVTQNINTGKVAYADETAQTYAAGSGKQYGMLLSKYKMDGCGRVDAVQVYLSYGAKNHAVKGVILNATGTVIDSSESFTPDSSEVNKYRTFYFPTIPDLSHNDYYVGLIQSADPANAYQSVGVQWDGTLPRTGAFYRANANGSGLAPFEVPGRLMIRAQVIPSGATADIAGKLSLCANDTNTLNAVKLTKRYANRVISFSTSGGGGVFQALGMPDAYPVKGVSAGVWTGSSPDSVREFLTVGFPAPAPINYIDIYETGGSEALDTVFVKDAAGNYIAVYTDAADSAAAAVSANNAAIKHIVFPTTAFDVSEVRLAVNSPKITGNYIVDAIVIGAVDSSADATRTYSWSTAATAQQISTAAAGNYVLTVTDQAGCTSSAAVNVFTPAIIIPTISSNRATTFCVGDSALKLTSSQLFHNVWSTGDTNRTITASTSGSYSVSYDDGNGCGLSSSAPIVVTANPLPVVTITGNPAFCPGASTTLDAGSGYVAYSWSTGAATQTISVSSIRTCTVTVTDGLGCKGMKSVTTIAASNPTPFISGNSYFCPGNGIALDAGSGYGSYAWSTGATTRTIAVSTAATYSVTVTNAAGCSGSSSATSHLFIPPSPAISGFSKFCPGGYTVLTANTGYAAYNWNNGSTTESIIANAAANYSVIVTDGNGCTGSTVSTTELFTPPTPAIDGELTFCTGGSTILDAGVTYAAYNWSTGETTHSIVVNASGSYSVVVTDNNGCTGTAAAITASTNGGPATPSAINGQTTGLCNLPAKTFSIAPVASATSYVWTVPSGDVILSGQGTTSINVQFNSFTTAYISVVALNDCGQSGVRTVEVNGTPALIGNIIGPAFGVCRMSNQVYTIAALPDISSYTWTVPTGASIISGQGSPSITVNYSSTFSNGSVCVNATNSCGSTSRCLSIAAVPTVPVSISGPTGVCKKQANVAYSIVPVYGATGYTWSVPPGAKVISGQGTTSVRITFGNTAGNVSVKASDACGSSTLKSLGVTFICRDAEEVLQPELSAYPNPASTEVHILFTATLMEYYRYQLVDLIGNVISTGEGIAKEGSNDLPVDVSAFVKGMYFFRYMDASESVRTIRFVVE